MFKEIWCTDPVLRIGTLDHLVAFNGTAITLSYQTPTVTRRDNPLPSDAVDRRSYNAPQSMVFTVEKIVNPQDITDDFVPNDDTDEFVSEFDARLNERFEYVLRKVGTVQMPTGEVSLRAVIEFQQRLGRFLEEYGWRPADPSIVLRDWCALSNLQPVADDPPVRYSSETTLCQRLFRALNSHGASLDDEDIQRISDWVRAASATHRSYEEAMGRLIRSVQNWHSSSRGVDGRQHVIDYLPQETQDALTRWVQVHRPDNDVLPHDPRRAEPPDTRQPGTSPVRPPPVNVGISIPINHPGRRAVNMETPDEVRDPFDALDRPDAGRRRGAGSDARSPRRTLRLDD